MKDCSLSGLRVLDMGRYVSGPYCTQLRADFGTEVIKIESPNGGDISRCCGPFPGDVPDPERSGLFLHLNTNKKSITLDWESEAGGEILWLCSHRCRWRLGNLRPLLEIPELLRYETEEARQKADEVDAQLIPWLASREAEEIFHRAQQWHLPFAMVLGADQLPADQQLRARGFFVVIDHPIVGHLTYPGAPFKMSENTWKAGRAPLLGEHNREIYSSSE